MRGVICTLEESFVVKQWTLTMAAGLSAAALVTTPILAQRGGDRPSRACIQEIVKLCGRDRSKIRSCLQEKASQLSDKCSAELQQRMQSRQSQRGNAGGQAAQAEAKVDRTIFYGEHQRQQIDLYQPKTVIDDKPLIVFIHGGGWSFGSHKAVQAKPKHFTDRGYFFASTGYRVIPDAPVEDQARDVGRALQTLLSQAQAIGFDPDSIVVMGHSAGAHLAALVSTDPQYASDAFGSIKGAILLDGAGYDIAANMSDAGPQALQLYKNVFGDDATRHKALSPAAHVGGPNAPNWLALYVDTRAPAKKQAELLVAGLTQNGANASAIAIANTDHGRLNRELGTEAGAQATHPVDTFLASLR